MAFADIIRSIHSLSAIYSHNPIHILLSVLVAHPRAAAAGPGPPVARLPPPPRAPHPQPSPTLPDQ